MKIIARVVLVATLACGSGCTRPDWIEQTLVTVDVTGTWQSTKGGLFEFELNQQGAQVKGAYRIVLGQSISGAIEGTVEGDMFRFRQTSGTYGPVQGEMRVSGEEMSGRLDATITASTGVTSRQDIVLQRVNSSSRPSLRQQQ